MRLKLLLILLLFAPVLAMAQSPAPSPKPKIVDGVFVSIARTTPFDKWKFNKSDINLEATFIIKPPKLPKNFAIHAELIYPIGAKTVVTRFSFGYFIKF